MPLLDVLDAIFAGETFRTLTLNLPRCLSTGCAFGRDSVSRPHTCVGTVYCACLYRCAFRWCMGESLWLLPWCHNEHAIVLMINIENGPCLGRGTQLSASESVQRHSGTWTVRSTAMKMNDPGRRRSENYHGGDELTVSCRQHIISRSDSVRNARCVLDYLTRRRQSGGSPTVNESWRRS